jgi:hypothetical protein
MAFTKAQEDQVVLALAQKIHRPCPSCNTDQRRIVTNLYVFNLYKARDTPALSTIGFLTDAFRAHNEEMQLADALPCVVVTCMNCGLTEFYNAHVLGVAAVLGIPPPGVPLAG